MSSAEWQGPRISAPNTFTLHLCRDPGSWVLVPLFPKPRNRSSERLSAREDPAGKRPGRCPRAGLLTPHFSEHESRVVPSTPALEASSVGLPHVGPRGRDAASVSRQSLPAPKLTGSEGVPTAATWGGAEGFFYEPPLSLHRRLPGCEQHLVSERGHRP